MEYTEQHQVEYNECDENKHLSLATLIDLLMQVSEHQLWHSTAGTKALNARGLGWVVTQYHFTINRLPEPMEKILLTTEAKGYNRFFEYRDFKITDEQGHELLLANSEWVLFDLEKRKMVATDKEMMEFLKIPLLTKLPHFPRLRPLKKYEQERPYRVRFDDLDTNHHLTNGHYFNWFVDLLDRDFLKNHVVKQIDIKFNQEVRYGQEPLSAMHLETNGEKIISQHAILDENRKAQTLCELSWRKL